MHEKTLQVLREQYRRQMIILKTEPGLLPAFILKAQAVCGVIGETDEVLTIM